MSNPAPPPAVVYALDGAARATPWILLALCAVLLGGAFGWVMVTDDPDPLPPVKSECIDGARVFTADDGDPIGVVPDLDCES